MTQILNLGLLAPEIQAERPEHGQARAPATAGRRKEAEAAYRDALILEKQLVAEFPAMPDYRRDLARSQENRALLLSSMSRPTDAEKAHQDAITLQKQLATEFPAIPEYRKELGRSQSNLGNLLYSRGRLKDAEAAYRDALAVRKELVAELPNVPEYQGQLAVTMVGLARIFRDQGDLLQVREILEVAALYNRVALKAEPRNRIYRQYYQANRVDLANILARAVTSAAATAGP